MKANNSQPYLRGRAAYTLSTGRYLSPILGQDGAEKKRISFS
jgi:hypothetical protein